MTDKIRQAAEDAADKIRVTCNFDLNAGIIERAMRKLMAARPDVVDASPVCLDCNAAGIRNCSHFDECDGRWIYVGDERFADVRSAVNPSAPSESPTPASEDELVKRITGYLASGGLFNPEMAIHDRVRDLLIDCRHALEIRAERVKEAERQGGWVEHQKWCQYCCGNGDGKPKCSDGWALYAEAKR